jgi:flagellar basal-body rod modification protein FlgD
MISSVNGSTTSSSSTSASGANKTLGKDDFLKLLISQLKNQDPLNPLDQNQFLAQTAQFTSLENLQNISTQLTEMKSLSSASSFAQSASLLGKTGRFAGSDFTLGTAGAVLPFSLDREAAVDVDIIDASGTVVRKLSSQKLDAGTQAVSWNGRDGAGDALAPGLYHYRVTAYGGAKAVAAEGTLTGLSPEGAGVIYRIGDTVVRPEDLIDIN